jgi:hypothetical protein
MSENTLDDILECSPGSIIRTNDPASVVDDLDAVAPGRCLDEDGGRTNLSLRYWESLVSRNGSFLVSRARARTKRLKGGAGAYSIWSWIAWAVSGSVSSATTVSAKSIPAVTPPPVMTLPSRTTRPPSGIAPNGVSRSRQAQWQAARLPRSSPAAPSASDPEQTEVTNLAVAASRRNAAKVIPPDSIAPPSAREGQQNVEGQAPHRCRRVELLRDRHEGRALCVEDEERG